MNHMRRNMKGEILCNADRYINSSEQHTSCKVIKVIQRAKRHHEKTIYNLLKHGGNQLEV